MKVTVIHPDTGPILHGHIVDGGDLVVDEYLDGWTGRARISAEDVRYVCDHSGVTVVSA